MTVPVKRGASQRDSAVEIQTPTRVSPLSLHVSHNQVVNARRSATKLQPASARFLGIRLHKVWKTLPRTA